MSPLQQKTLTAIKGALPGFDSFNPSEQFIQGCAYVCDKLKPREDKGNNHGILVDDFLNEAGGISPGAPWCAAVMNWVTEMLALPNPDKHDAAVFGWKEWAERNGRLHKTPKRGALCLFLNRNGTGHIGAVKGFDEINVSSIEGNTSPGIEGSQRDGQGMYRRTRKKSIWTWYIYLD
jgi:hypothetical protein